MKYGYDLTAWARPLQGCPGMWVALAVDLDKAGVGGSPLQAIQELQTTIDLAVASSPHDIFPFGLVPPSDPRLLDEMSDAVTEILTVGARADERVLEDGEAIEGAVVFLSRGERAWLIDEVFVDYVP